MRVAMLCGNEWPDAAKSVDLASQRTFLHAWRGDITKNGMRCRTVRRHSQPEGLCTAPEHLRNRSDLRSSALLQRQQRLDVASLTGSLAVPGANYMLLVH